MLIRAKILLFYKDFLQCIRTCIVSYRHSQHCHLWLVVNTVLHSAILHLRPDSVNFIFLFYVEKC